MDVLTKASVPEEAGFAEVVGLITDAQQRAFQAVNTTLCDTILNQCQSNTYDTMNRLTAISDSTGSGVGMLEAVMVVAAAAVVAVVARGVPQITGASQVAQIRFSSARRSSLISSASQGCLE
jgi:hypothetical protein